MRVESQIGMKELMSLPHLLQELYLVLLQSMHIYDKPEAWVRPPQSSELWYRPPQTFGALVLSTSIIRSSGIVHLNRSELWYRPSQLSEVWAKCPPQSELWYRPPHWLARVYPPASPRVDLVRVHSPSDPVMTSLFRPSITHSLAFLTMVRYWNQSHFTFLLDTTTSNTTTATKSTITKSTTMT
jgi:hypothetical protein